MIEIGRGISIDEREIQVEFIRASGPGGQNVNKLNSAVQLRFDVKNSPSLPEELRERLLHLAGRRLTAAGVLVIEARQHRTQEQNRRAALERLVGLVRRALEKPKPRKHTRPTAASRQRRLEAKRRRGEVKRLRQVRPDLD